MRDGYAQRVWRYLTFANWTWSDPADAARIRAGWPTWRKAVRPIGAAAWWLAGVVGFITDESENVLTMVLVAIAALCVLFGIVDGFTGRRARNCSISSAPEPASVPAT